MNDSCQQCTALKLSIKELVKDNNELRKTLLNTKTECIKLKRVIEDYSNWKNKIQNEEKLAITKESQLIDHINQITFKYNQLMDLIHSDPTFERKYIKRLIKYKHMSKAHKEIRDVEIRRDIQQGQCLKCKEIIMDKDQQINRLQIILQEKYSSIVINQLSVKNQKIDLFLKDQQIQFYIRENKKLKSIIKQQRSTSTSRDHHYYKIQSREKLNESKNRDIILIKSSKSLKKVPQYQLNYRQQKKTRQELDRKDSRSAIISQLQAKTITKQNQRSQHNPNTERSNKERLQIQEQSILFDNYANYLNLYRRLEQQCRTAKEQIAKLNQQNLTLQLQLTKTVLRNKFTNQSNNSRLSQPQKMLTIEFQHISLQLITIKKQKSLLQQQISQLQRILSQQSRQMKSFQYKILSKNDHQR